MNPNLRAETEQRAKLFEKVNLERVSTDKFKTTTIGSSAG